jgi:hypothetical protein
MKTKDKLFKKVHQEITKGFQYMKEESQMMIPSLLVYVRDVSRVLFRENLSKFQSLTEDITFDLLYENISIEVYSMLTYVQESFLQSTIFEKRDIPYVFTQYHFYPKIAKQIQDFLSKSYPFPNTLPIDDNDSILSLTTSSCFKVQPFFLVLRQLFLESISKPGSVLTFQNLETFGEMIPFLLVAHIELLKDKIIQNSDLFLSSQQDLIAVRFLTFLYNDYKFLDDLNRCVERPATFQQLNKRSFPFVLDYSLPFDNLFSYE